MLKRNSSEVLRPSCLANPLLRTFQTQSCLLELHPKDAVEYFQACVFDLCAMDDETTEKEMTCDHSADLEAMCLEDLGVVSGDWRGLRNCGKYMHEFITFIFRM